MAEILSPYSFGTGVSAVHNLLEQRLMNYHVLPFSPKLNYFPPFIYFLTHFKSSEIIHCAPDYAFLHYRKNRKLILTIHNFMLDEFMQNYSSLAQTIHYQTDLKWLYRKAFEKAEYITAVSHFTANLALQSGLTNKKIEVIYNGVDHLKFHPVESSHSGKKIKVLFSGNLSRRKGAWLIPAILDQLQPNVTIVYTRGLRSKSKLLSHPQLICVGSVSHGEMPNLYRGVDMLLLPSVREGFSMSVLEAMSTGLPVIATDGSSFPEMIDEGKGGYLCELGNANLFAEKINLLATDSDLRTQMGHYNRKKVERLYTVSQMIEKYEKVFNLYY